MRRIVLYSHDTLGLGHLRRNLLIAQYLASFAKPAVILLITGTSQARAFELPPGVDCLCLPSVCKRDGGRYRSRRLRISGLVPDSVVGRQRAGMTHHAEKHDKSGTRGR